MSDLLYPVTARPTSGGDGELRRLSGGEAEAYYRELFSFLPAHVVLGRAGGDPEAFSLAPSSVFGRKADGSMGGLVASDLSTLLDLVNLLAQKAALVHSHSIQQVVGLQTALSDINAAIATLQSGSGGLGNPLTADLDIAAFRLVQGNIEVLRREGNQLYVGGLPMPFFQPGTEELGMSWVWQGQRWGPDFVQASFVRQNHQTGTLGSTVQTAINFLLAAITDLQNGGGSGGIANPLSGNLDVAEFGLVSGANPLISWDGTRVLLGGSPVFPTEVSDPQAGHVGVYDAGLQKFVNRLLQVNQVQGLTTALNAITADITALQNGGGSGGIGNPLTEDLDIAAFKIKSGTQDLLAWINDKVVLGGQEIFESEITNPLAKHVAIYNESTGKFANRQLKSSDILGAGAGSTTVADEISSIETAAAAAQATADAASAQGQDAIAATQTNASSIAAIEAQPTPTVGDGEITEAKLAPEAVTGPKIATGTIPPRAMVDGALMTSVRNGAVFNDTGIATAAWGTSGVAGSYKMSAVVRDGFQDSSGYFFGRFAVGFLGLQRKSDGAVNLIANATTVATSAAGALALGDERLDVEVSFDLDSIEVILDGVSVIEWSGSFTHGTTPGSIIFGGLNNSSARSNGLTLYDVRLIDPADDTNTAYFPLDEGTRKTNETFRNALSVANGGVSTVGDAVVTGTVQSALVLSANGGKPVPVGRMVYLAGGSNSSSQSISGAAKYLSVGNRTVAEVTAPSSVQLIEAPTDGIYVLAASISFAANADALDEVRIEVETLSSGLGATSEVEIGANEARAVPVTAIAPITAGEWLAIQVDSVLGTTTTSVTEFSWSVHFYPTTP